MYDLINKCNKSSQPGTTQRLFRVPISWVTLFPESKAAYEIGQGNVPAQGDSIRLNGDIILDTTIVGEGKFGQFDIRVNSGLLNDNMVGEQGGTSFESSLDFQIIGTRAEELEFAFEASKGCYLYITKQRNGNYRILGNPEDPAYAESIEITSGQKAGDFEGGTYRLKASTGRPAMIYTGVMDLTPNP